MKSFLRSSLPFLFLAMLPACVIDCRDGEDDWDDEDSDGHDGSDYSGGWSAVGGAPAQGGFGGGGVIEGGASATGGESASGGASQGGAPATGGASEGGGGEGGAEPAPYRVFLTSNTYEGDFASLSSGSALPTADTLCQVAANAASLGGFWRAWLSDDTTSAIDRIGGEEWVDLAGASIFPNRATLSTGPVAPLARDEEGTVHEADAQIWTGTSVLGGSTGDNCDGWTSVGDAIGTVGDPLFTDNRWTDNGTAACSATRARFACFEQPEPPPQ